MLVVFLLDTSASMNQRCANGLSLLDCAKSAVEHFHKVRSRDMSSRADRYMLVTCEDGPECIKAVDKHPFPYFMRALKSVQARDLTNIGAAMQRIFSFLHVQRLAVDIDRFGQGRNPCSIDPTTILLLTDGTELTSLAGVTQSLLQNGPNPVGADLSSQKFRWDQRVFATVLRIPSVGSAVLERSGPIPQNAPISNSQTAFQMDNIISAFCDITGGKCWVATSWKVLMQHTEATALRLPPCVIVSFEHMPLTGNHTLPPHVQAACQRKMLLVRGGQGQQGHWPIPEAFWPDPSQPGIPPRDPHPTIAYKAVDADPFIPPNFICDKYEIESNPILGFLAKTQGVCWQVYVKNSKGLHLGYGDPFGYLRLNRGQTILTLVILPYNYPVLWQLLEQAGKVPGATKMPPLPQWRQDMERYCNSIPSYYGHPLRTALKRWGLSAHVVPEAMENSLVSGFVGTQLKRLKQQAKADLDEDMKHILTEQQMLGAVSAGGGGTHKQGRTFPLVASTAGTQPPPGFPAGIISGGGNHAAAAAAAAATSSVPGNPPPTRGVGQGDQLTARKDWQVLVPSGPTSTAGGPPVQPVGIMGMAYGSGLGLVNNDSNASAASVGVMKDIAVFKNPFNVPRDQLLRQLRYLPFRIAVAMDAKQTRRMERENVKGKGSAISVLAARIAAKEEEEARHSLPIEKMGDFNEALMKQQPPRNPFIDEQDRSKQNRTMFGNPYRQEKGDGADEMWMEGGPGGPFSKGRKRRRRLESPGASTPSASNSGSSSGSAVDSNSDTAASGSSEVTSPARPLSEAQTPAQGQGQGQVQTQNAEGSVLRRNSHADVSKPSERSNDVRMSDPARETGSPVDTKGSTTTSVSDNGVSDMIADGHASTPVLARESQAGAAAAASPDAPNLASTTSTYGRVGGQLSSDSSSRLVGMVIPIVDEPRRSLRKMGLVWTAPSGAQGDKGEAVEILLSLLRELRYAKPSSTQKLFEILSTPDFPFDKLNILEQLILKAQRYNKVAVMKQLIDYRNQFTAEQPPVAAASPAAADKA